MTRVHLQFVSMHLEEFLRQIKNVPPEQPLEPELKSHRVKQDKKIRYVSPVHMAKSHVRHAWAYIGNTAVQPTHANITSCPLLNNRLSNFPVLYSANALRGCF